MVKEIPLQNGMVALVDDEDFERVNKFKWCYLIDNKVEDVENGDCGLGYFILQPNKGEAVVRIDKKILDFTKKNLRVISRNKVPHTSKGQSGSTSKYKGVSWRKDMNKWRARVRIDGKEKHLGYFINEDAAALAYNKAAKEFYGEHSYQNVIGEDNNASAANFEKQVQHRAPSWSSSKYHGVFWDKRVSKWVAQVHFKKSCFKVGGFVDETEAAKTYDKKAYELHGDKAILNFPELINEYKLEE